MLYYIICNEEKTFVWDKKKIQICDIKTNLKRALAQYRTSEGIVPEETDDIIKADFIVRIGEDITSPRFLESTMSIESERGINIIYPDVNNVGMPFRLLKPILFINFGSMMYNIVDDFKNIKNNNDTIHLYALLNLSPRYGMIYDNKILENNKWIKEFMMEIDENIIYEPIIHNNKSYTYLKILYWFFGFVAICLIAFGLYKLYKKYKKPL